MGVISRLPVGTNMSLTGTAASATILLPVAQCMMGFGTLGNFVAPVCCKFVICVSSLGCVLVLSSGKVSLLVVTKGFLIHG